jgi:hypothetical protein
MPAVRSPSKENLLDVCRRESDSFKAATVAFYTACRLRIWSLQRAKGSLGPLDLSDEDSDYVIAELQRRAPSGSRDLTAELIEILQKDVIPSLEAFDSGADPAKKGRKKGRPPFQKSHRLDRKVSLGFVTAVPAIPIVLAGEPDAVKEAIAYVVKEHSGASRIVYFSPEPAQEKGRWLRRKNNCFEVFAPSWHFPIYRRTNLIQTMKSLEQAQEGHPFDVLAISDIGADPVSLPAQVRQLITRRKVPRACEATKRAASWANSRGTVLVAGLSLSKTDEYRQVELQRFYSFADVYQVYKDAGILYAKDSKGHEHDLSD